MQVRSPANHTLIRGLSELDVAIVLLRAVTGWEF